jgi:hypothetical protein
MGRRSEMNNKVHAELSETSLLLKPMHNRHHVVSSLEIKLIARIISAARKSQRFGDLLER